jgi:hypothetical protein
MAFSRGNLSMMLSLFVIVFVLQRNHGHATSVEEDRTLLSRTCADAV